MLLRKCYILGTAGQFIGGVLSNKQSYIHDLGLRPYLSTLYTLSNVSYFSIIIGQVFMFVV